MMRGIKLLETCQRSGNYASKDHQVHNVCEICYMMQGKRGFNAGEELITMETGSLLFLNQNVLHRSVPIADEPYEYFIMCFHPELSSQWQHIVPDINFSWLYSFDYVLLEPNMMDQVFVKGIIKTLITAYNANMQGVFYLKLIELIVYLAMKTRKSNFQRLSNKKSAKKKHYSELIKFIEERNFNVTLDEICRHLFLSRYYICHLFKDESGMTINEYINFNKIRKAMKLIETTELPITGIAEACEYDSISSFGRNFKKYTGISPSEYRKRNEIHKRNQK